MRTSLRSRALTGVRWSAIQNSGSRLAVFVVFLVLARLLAPEDFGLVAMAAGFVAIVETFVDMGLRTRSCNGAGGGPALPWRRRLRRSRLGLGTET